MQGGSQPTRRTHSAHTKAHHSRQFILSLGQILPEEVIASYDRVGELSGEFFGYDEDTQDECIDIPEMRSIQVHIIPSTRMLIRCGQYRAS